MFQTINGWTKKKMLQYIKDNFKGKSGTSEKCFYRGPDDKKCAAGLFIPDELYDDQMDLMEKNGANIDVVVRKFLEVEDLMPLKVGEFMSPMRRFQLAHDRLDDNEDMEGQTDALLDWINKNVAD